MTPDTFTEALIEIVKAAGKSNAVGLEMRPDLRKPEAAGQWLRDCLNAERREKLSPDQVLWLLAKGHQIGCHAAMEFIGSEIGYTVTPIQPKDTDAQLQRQFIEAVSSMNKLTAKLEQRGVLKAVA